MKFATQCIRHYSPHLRHVATLPRKIKNSSFCKYSADAEENANKLHFKCTNFNSSMHITVFWLYLCVFIKILSLSLNTMLIVDKHCSDVCCDEFPVGQIDRKSKQVKEQSHGKFCLQPVWRTTRYLKCWEYQNLWMINKVRGDVMQFAQLLSIWRKFELLISQGSVATYLRWDG